MVAMENTYLVDMVEREVDLLTDASPAFTYRASLKAAVERYLREYGGSEMRWSDEAMLYGITAMTFKVNLKDDGADPAFVTRLIEVTAKGIAKQAVCLAKAYGLPVNADVSPILKASLAQASIKV